MKHQPVALFLILCVLVTLTGCGQSQAASSEEAIQQSKSMQATAEEKTAYLIAQAKAMYKSKQFQDTVDVAQYVLRYLDKDSQEAQKLLAMAKEDLMEAGSQALDEAKKKFSL